MKTSFARIRIRKHCSSFSLHIFPKLLDLSSASVQKRCHTRDVNIDHNVLCILFFFLMWIFPISLFFRSWFLPPPKIRFSSFSSWATLPPIVVTQHEYWKIPVQVIDHCFKCVSKVIVMHYQATTFLTAPSQEVILSSSVLALSTNQHKATEKFGNFFSCVRQVLLQSCDCYTD